MSQFSRKVMLALVSTTVAFTISTVAKAQQNISLGLSIRQNLSSDWFGYNGANVTRNGLSWVNTDLLNNLPLLKPKIIRYPPTANFWDWKVGWYVNSPLLPSKFKNLPPQPDYLEDFKSALYACNAEAIFTLNMITANLQDQIAMLEHADSIGIPVLYVELGNEFYLAPNDPDVQEGIVVVDSIFPTPQSYGLAANLWIDSIHKHFPAAKVCIDGSYEKAGAGRRGIWNDSMKSVLSGREDAWSFHVYQSSSWMDTTQTTIDLAAETLDEVPDWLYQPQKALGILQESMNKMNPGKEAWITEYNLNDGLRPVQGLWAHGLFNAELTLQYFQDLRVKHIVCYDADGNALYGQYFTDTVGFILSANDSFPQLPNPPSTIPWGLTASGNTMKMLGQCIDSKNSICQLTFSPLPQQMIVEAYNRDTFFLNGLQGYLFVNQQGSNAYIMNLTGNTYNINTSGMFPSGSSYTMKYANPLSPIASADSVKMVAGPLPSTLVAKPYSVVRITSSFIPSSAPTVTINPSNSVSFCEGDSVWLNAGNGFASYLWSTGETTKSIWAKSGGEYWVRVTSSKKAYAGCDTVNVTMYPAPVKPAITRNGPTTFCADFTVQISIVQPIPDSVTYAWNTGATTSLINVNTSGTYWAVYTSNMGCTTNSDAQTITVHPLPVPSISVSGPTTFCNGGSVTLTANPSGDSYYWSGGATTQSVTATKTGSFFVMVVDANSCKATTPILNVTEILLPNPTITVNGPSTYCADAASTYLQTISGYNYQWLKGTTSVSGATQQSYTPTTNGTYKVKITDVNGCTNTTTNGKTITVNANPTASISTSSSTNLCNGQTALLKANSGSGQSYHWQKDGSNINGATGVNYTATNAGTYTCKVTKTSTGCYTISNSIVITTNCKTEGETISTSGELKIYPNPASDMLNVEATFDQNQSGEAWLEIHNMLGQLVLQSQIEVNDGVLQSVVPLNNFVAGMYMVSIRLDQKIISAELEVK
ncbi:MAG: T9SS type A sorting domain-containing protein [Chitinophagales bacterium]